MAARRISLVCLQLFRHRLGANTPSPTARVFQRPWRTCTTTAATSSTEENVSSVDRCSAVSVDRTAKDPGVEEWEEKKKEIRRDIGPIVSLAKEIIRSKRYFDGEQLTLEDERAVVEKLLKYHPNAEDKIGCGLDSIMVDRHPQYRFTRCLFAVRIDGGWTDFSYLKCLRAYIQEKYPLHAERFIREHFNGIKITSHWIPEVVEERRQHRND